MDFSANIRLNAFAGFSIDCEEKLNDQAFEGEKSMELYCSSFVELSSSSAGDFCGDLLRNVQVYFGVERFIGLKTKNEI